VLLIAGCGGSREKDGGPVPGSRLTIYSSMPLEGPDRDISVDVVRAERLALREHGGRAGRYAIQLVSLDAATPKAAEWDPAQISKNARLAAKDPDTIAYVGELHSGSSAISIPLLNEAGILEVSPLDTAMELTTRTLAIAGSPLKYYPNLQKVGRTFARVVPNDRVQADALALYMRQEGVERLAILTDDDTNGLPLAATVKASAKAAGITVVPDEDPIDAHAKDQSERAAKIAATGADAVFFVGSTRPGVVQLWRALSLAEPSLQLYAPGAVVDAPFIAAIGSARGETRVTRPPLALSDYPPASRRFLASFRGVYGYTPAPDALYGYEAMRAVLDAIDRGEAAAGNAALTRPDVVRAFFRTRARGTVLGDYDIDPSGDTSLHQFGAYRAVGRQLRFVRPLDVAPPGG
jgi:branched-chain amino acid transport system substrate-binding protein